MLAEILISSMMFIDLVLCPYTKVEESFNLQALHDLLHHPSNLENFDHLVFPGVVPRTFLGPIFIAAVSSPFLWVLKALNHNKFLGQYIVRSCLGFFVLIAFLKFHDAVKRDFGKSASNWLTLITVTQFHFIFYMSRPLPNIFALPLVLLAIQWWMRQKHDKFIWISACAIIVFRGELAILLGIMLLMDLIAGRISIKDMFIHAIPAGIFWLGLTTVVDSYFWQRPLWPEGEVLWYNIILNKSSNWGTMPFFWYFNTALPRALAFSLPFVPLGVYLDIRLRVLLIPSISFVFLYSFLPHKELRFIIYVIPILNTSAAVACDRFWKNRSKESLLNKVFALASCGHLLMNLLARGGFLYLSFLNYPGGLALYHFHNIVPPHANVHLHIDVASAQTGISHFGEIQSHWIYNKTENLVPGGKEMLQFTHLVIGTTSNENAEIKPYQETHKILGAVSAFDYIKLNKNWKNFKFPIEIVTRPKIWVLQRNSRMSKDGFKDKKS